MKTLINAFEVPENLSDDEFLADWREAANYMGRQPGFVRADLHRSSTPGARFRFVNIAKWESVDAFQAAIANPEFRRLAAGGPPSFPALYEVVLTAGASERASTGEVEQ